MKVRENPEIDILSECEERETENPSALPRWLLDTPWWTISALLHLLILALVGGIVLTRKTPVAKARDMSLMVRRYKPIPFNPVPPVGLKESPPIPGKRSKNRPVKILKPEKITPDIPTGTSRENMADKELNGKYAVDVFGPGGGAAVLMRHPPRWRLRRGKAPATINMYYWYYGTLAMFQYGDGPWREWNKAMVKALVPTQRHAGDVKGHGCEAGSWDPIGEWGLAGGRVYATAMGALTLEVYYRFKRVDETRDAL